VTRLLSTLFLPLPNCRAQQLLDEHSAFLQQQLQQQQCCLDARNEIEIEGEMEGEVEGEVEGEQHVQGLDSLSSLQLWEPGQGSLGQLHAIVLWAMALARWGQLVSSQATPPGITATGSGADFGAGASSAVGAAWSFWFYLCLLTSLLPNHFEPICLLNIVTILPARIEESDTDSQWLGRMRLLAMTFLVHVCSIQSSAFDDVEGMHTFGVLVFDPDPQIAM
jgi:hypothetical protein